MKKETAKYIGRLEKLASNAATEYKNVRVAPYEVDTREIRIRKERYIKWSYTIWGAIQALSIEGSLNEKEQEYYEDRICRLDEIAYEDD